MKDDRAEWTWLMFADPSRGDCVAQVLLDPEKLDAPPAIASMRFLMQIQLSFAANPSGEKVPVPNLKPVWIHDPILKPIPCKHARLRFTMLVWWGEAAENIVAIAEKIALNKPLPPPKPVIATEMDAKVEGKIDEEKRKFEMKLVTPSP
jgi:hypothetical protein